MNVGCLVLKTSSQIWAKAPKGLLLIASKMLVIMRPVIVDGQRGKFKRAIDEIQKMSDSQRTLSQNARFHAMVRDISKQLKWAGLMWDETDWKNLVLAAKYGQVVGPNPFGHGLLIMNKMRSSKLKKSGDEANMADLINELQAFGDENGVSWTDPNFKSLMESAAREVG